MPERVLWTEDMVAAMESMLKLGCSRRAMARRIGVSRQTVSAYCVKAGIDQPKVPQRRRQGMVASIGFVAFVTKFGQPSKGH